MCEPSAHPHSVAYKKKTDRLKHQLFYFLFFKKKKRRKTDLQRTMTCTLTPLSLSCLLLELELKSPDHKSLADLSVDRGVCDGETIPPPPLLCCDKEEESIIPQFNCRTFSVDSLQQLTKSACPPLSLFVSILLFIKPKRENEFNIWVGLLLLYQ